MGFPRLWVHVFLNGSKVSSRRLYASSEKLNNIIDKVAQTDEGGKVKEVELPKKPAVGHGRKKADDYVAAEVVKVAHELLHRGCSCPGCEKGKLGKQKPSCQIKIKAMPPIVTCVKDFVATSVGRSSQLRLQTGSH